MFNAVCFPLHSQSWKEERLGNSLKRLKRWKVFPEQENRSVRSILTKIKVSQINGFARIAITAIPTQAVAATSAAVATIAPTVPSSKVCRIRCHANITTSISRSLETEVSGAKDTVFSCSSMLNIT